MNPASLAARRFRSRRMRLFLKELEVTPETRILDVGGTPFNWELCPLRPQVTLVNLPRAREPLPAGFRLVEASGCALPFADRSFDIAFCNSVIEHLGDSGDRRRLAGEIRRVAARYWVQTPNRGFPIEPHLATPLVHWLPRQWQERIVRRASFWQWLERPTADRRQYYVEHYLRDIRLLDAGELAELFPDAVILKEKFLGLTKSLIAVRR